MSKQLKTAVPSVEEILEWDIAKDIDTCFDRADRMKP